MVLIKYVIGDIFTDTWKQGNICVLVSRSGLFKYGSYAKGAQTDVSDIIDKNSPGRSRTAVTGAKSRKD